MTRLNALTWNYSTKGRTPNPTSKRSYRKSMDTSLPDRKATRPDKRPEKRWHHRLRLLDLLRSLSGEEPKPRQPARARKTYSAMAGDSPGPTTAGSSTTARPRVPMASPGANARNLSGGTKRKSEWTGLDDPDYEKEYLPTRPRLAKRQRHARIAGGARPFILASRWRRLALRRERIEGWTATHPLRSRWNPWLQIPCISNTAIRPRIRKQRPDNPYANLPTTRASPTC